MSELIWIVGHRVGAGGSEALEMLVVCSSSASHSPSPLKVDHCTSTVRQISRGLLLRQSQEFGISGRLIL